MIHSLFSIAVTATLLLAAFGLGRPLLRVLRIELADDDLLGIGAWGVGLGLVAAGMVLTFLGLLGLLYTPLIAALTILAVFWAATELLEQRQLMLARWPQPFAVDYVAWHAEPPRWLRRLLLASAGIASAAALVSALAPPTAGDALCYHLELPKRFLQDHQLSYIADSDNSTFPLLVEMWYLWALSLGDGVAAQLMHWSLGLLMASAAVLLARPLVGQGWSVMAGCVVLITPGVNNQMAAPLNDVGLAAMAALSLAAWRVALEGPHRRAWCGAAGIFLGAALATKYVAIVFALAVAMVWLGMALRQPARQREWRGAAWCVLAVALLVCSVWYARAAWHRGNPVYPFFDELAAAAEGTQPQFETLRDSKAPLGRSPAALLAAPWQLTMYPERFGGRGHQLGAVFLVCLPGLLISRHVRKLSVLLAIAALFACICWMLRQNVRFLFPVVPLLAVGVVWTWTELGRMPLAPRQVAWATVAALVAFSALIPVVRLRHHWLVAVGGVTREAWLAEHEPTYLVANWANSILPPGSHLLSQEHRAFYFQHQLTRENIYRRRTSYDAAVTSERPLSAQLRAAGFTHLLLASSQGPGAVPYDDTLARLVDAEQATHADSLVLLEEYRHQEPGGAMRHYRLMALR